MKRLLLPCIFITFSAIPIFSQGKISLMAEPQEFPLSVDSMFKMEAYVTNNSINKLKVPIVALAVDFKSFGRDEIGVKIRNKKTRHTYCTSSVQYIINPQEMIVNPGEKKKLLINLSGSCFPTKGVYAIKMFLIVVIMKENLEKSKRISSKKFVISII